MTPCERCAARCCQAVKRLPYQGENAPALFGEILMGAFPDTEPRGPGPQPPRRPFVAEWIIPGEDEACPVYGPDGRCRLYALRPRACRTFPVASDGGRHPFCSWGQEFLPEPDPEPPFLSSLAALDAHLLQLLATGREAQIGGFIGEENPFEMPLLYNGYLLAVWLLAGVDIGAAIEGQRQCLMAHQAKGREEITVLIPGTELQMTAAIEGLLVNLEWLDARIVYQGLAHAVARNLGDVSMERARPRLFPPCRPPGFGVN